MAGSPHAVSALSEDKWEAGKVFPAVKLTVHKQNFSRPLTNPAQMVYFGKSKGNDEDSICFSNITASRNRWEPVSVEKQWTSLPSRRPKVAASKFSRNSSVTGNHINPFVFNERSVWCKQVVNVEFIPRPFYGRGIFYNLVRCSDDLKIKRKGRKQCTKK